MRIIQIKLIATLHDFAMQSSLEKQFTHAHSFFSKNNTNYNVDSGLIASYNISRITAKCGKFHSEGSTAW